MKQLSEIEEREATVLRNAADSNAHIDKQLTQLSAKMGTSAKNEPRRMEMVVPAGYVGKARPVADAQAAMIVSAVQSGVAALRTENSELKTRIQNLEATQAAKPAPVKPTDYVALATKVFGRDQVSNWNRHCNSDLSEHCKKVFFLENLSDVVPGIDAASMRVQHGEPQKLFGLSRAQHANKRQATLKALATL